MGVTGGLMRSIFFRNKSFGGHEYNGGEKKRWSSVRSYLCGDEFNSVLAVNDSGSIKDCDALLTMSHQQTSDSASSLITPLDSVLAIEDSASVKQLEEEDSVSVKSSEETVTQPLHEKNPCNHSDETETHIPKMHQTPISKLLLEDEAAVTIQTAFRSYLVARQSKEGKKMVVKAESFSEQESLGKVSMGTSIEVRTGNSTNTPFFRKERRTANRRKLERNKAQVLRIKEDWDDSTVSNTISKLRIQSRLEAMTKRERALAYAFSQQLRICTKKKQTERSSEDEEPNISWSWLERWMATRVPDSVSIEPRTNTQVNIATGNQRLLLKKRPFIVAGELESCASNDLPLQFGNISETQEEENQDLQTEKSSLNTSISKRKSGPSYHQRRHNRLQATKRDLRQQTKNAKKVRSTPSGCKRELNAMKPTQVKY